MGNNILINQIIVSQCSDSIIILDENKKVIFINPKLLSYLNISREELYGGALQQIFSDLDSKLILDNQNTQRVSLDKKNSKDLLIFEFNTSVVEDETLIILKDITPQVELKRSVTENRFKYQFLFDHIQCGVINVEYLCFRDTFVIKDINQILIDKLQLPKKASLLERDLLDIFPYFKDSGIYENIVDSLEKKEEIFSKDHTILINQKDFWFESKVYSLSENEIVILIFDTTKYKELKANLSASVEKEIKKRERLKNHSIIRARQDSMRELVFWITHHWRQPLNVINLIAEDILDLYEYGELDKETLQGSVDKITKNVLSMSNVLDIFSNFTRSNEKSEEFDLVESLNSVVEKVQLGLSEKKIALKIAISGNDNGMILIYGHKNSFEQGLLELIQNAVDAIEKKREEEPIQGKIRVSFLERVDDVKITITGNGILIKESNVEKVFEPYYTSKEKQRDVGLGLFIVRNIIENDMGGKIYCQYNSIGSKFIIELPKSDKVGL